MKVLVACEFSGIVRDAFIAKGHDAVSCDLLPTERPGPHYQGDVRDLLGEQFDLMIAHPPCTHLAVSGARWFAEKNAEHPEWQRDAIDFFMLIANANIPMKCIENPIGIMSRIYRKPDQVIHPWQFGEPETKATCLWLTGVQCLTPTKIVEGRNHTVFKCPPGPDRWKVRSRTFEGIAQAMAEQWGNNKEIQP